MQETRPLSTAGSAGFFDQYPRFYGTSDTMPYPNRLNNRYKALIERHNDVLQGSSVLDLASHDGRWSFAALKNGANKVVGLEGQSVLVEDAKTSFEQYGIPQDRYQFVCGDLFETVKTFNPGDFDVVFCFGFFHMHNRHFEMLGQIQRLKPAWVIVDVWVLPFTDDPVTYLIPHVVDAQGVARCSPDFSYPLALREKTVRTVSLRDGSGIRFGGSGSSSFPEVMLLAYPSEAALEWLLAEAGFGEIDYYDWKNAPITDWNELYDYQAGQRVSLIARNMRIRRDPDDHGGAQGAGESGAVSQQGR